MKKLKLDKGGNWIVAAPLVVVNLIYVVFFFLPGQKEIEGMRQEILDTQMYLATAAIRPAEIERVGGELELATAYNEEWRKDAPYADSIARLFSEINRRAGDAGVAVRRFEPRQIDEMAHLDRVTLQLSTDGSFEQMFQLMRQLESLPETVWVDALQFRARKVPTNLASTLTGSADASVQSELNLAIFAAKSEDSN